MSRLECSNLGIQISAGKSHVADHIQKLMSSAFVREMKFQIAEIAAFAYAELRLVEKCSHPVELFISDRVLHDYDGIVHVTALYQIVGEEELNLVEENESAARADFICIILGQVPRGALDAKYMGIDQGLCK